MIKGNKVKWPRGIGIQEMTPNQMQCCFGGDGGLSILVLSAVAGAVYLAGLVYLGTTSDSSENLSDPKN